MRTYVRLTAKFEVSIPSASIGDFQVVAQRYAREAGLERAYLSWHHIGWFRAKGLIELVGEDVDVRRVARKLQILIEG